MGILLLDLGSPANTPLMIKEIQAACDFMIRERAFDHVKVWTKLKHQLLCFISSSLAASGA